MTEFKQIELLLVDIVDSGYLILDELEADDVAYERVRSLLDERMNKIAELNKVSAEDHDFGEQQRYELRNLFTRFTLLEKQINTILGKLSLLSKTSLKEVAMHKKAKKSYRTPFKTSRFLNTQVAG